MAPFSKPETVLKQAEGLISVGQQNAALQSFTEMFSSKRFRSTPITSLEPIMLRFVELCVDMRRGRTAKEGLLQYKNIAQHLSVASIETVIKKFLSLADAKVQEAQQQAEKAVNLEVDDLEASETPEDVLLGAVSGDQSKDRTDRALVTPWLKFSWESYRTALEVLKNNARLELIYQQVAALAFKFCLKYVRKVEFRRLCDTLRLHLANVAKYANMPNQQFSINLSDPDTLQRYLDTRFAQLNASVELELWQEAFRSVEDIHNLLTLAKKAPRPAMMANYYEQLTRIFLTSGNALYHAAAWSKYYSVVRAMGGKSEDELAKLAGLVLISALAIPVVDGEEEESRSKSTRLASLVGFSKPPKRSSLLRDALLRNTLAVSRPEVQSLYQILEVDLHPLTMCSTIAPIFRSLAADPEYAPYLTHLNRVLLSRLLGQLGQVYSSVRLSYISELVAPVNEPWNLPTPAEGTTAGAVAQEIWDESKLEASIMGCARRGELNIRVDHVEGTITFVTDLFGDASSSTPGASTSSSTQPASQQLQPNPAELIRTRFSRLATALSNSLDELYPPAEDEQEDQAEKFATLVKAAEEERRQLAIRRVMITRRAELLAELSVRKKQEEESRRAEAARKKAEDDARNAVIAARKREAERIQREIDQANKEEAKNMAKNLIAKGGLKINDEDIIKYDTNKLVQLQVEQLDKEKRDLAERLRILHKRIDHLERAYRKEEAPLLAQDYERQQKEDLVTHEENAKMTLVLAQQKHAEDLATKKRMARMQGDYAIRRKEIAGHREEEFQKKRAEAQAAMEAEKEARRQQVAAERAAEKARRDEEERLRREEEELLEQQEEEQRAEQERLRAEEEAAAAAAEAKKQAEAEKVAAARAAREAEDAKTLELVRLRQQREEEAEARRANRKLEPTPRTTSSGFGRGAAANGGAELPPPSAGAWRPGQRGTAQAVTNGSSTPPSSTPSTPAPRSSSGAYRPPGFRGSGELPPSRDAPRDAPSSGRPSIFGSARPREEAPLRTSSPAPARASPFGAAKAVDIKEKTADSDGFQKVASTEKWKPRGARGPGEVPPR